MADAYILEAARTAIGRKNGALAHTRPDDLAAAALKGLVARAGVDPAQVEDIIMGCVTQLGEQGMKAGVALNPHTSIYALMDVLEDIDLVCLMSVNPGFGGQKFIPQTLKKTETLKNEITRLGCATLIEIDGGVSLQNAGDLFRAGADVLVAGNTVFSSENPTQTITDLLNCSK